MAEAPPPLASESSLSRLHRTLSGSAGQDADKENVGEVKGRFMAATQSSRKKEAASQGARSLAVGAPIAEEPAAVEGCVRLAGTLRATRVESRGGWARSGPRQLATGLSFRRTVLTRARPSSPAQRGAAGTHAERPARPVRLELGALGKA